MVNGGNCPYPATNWVHYVHGAFTPIMGSTAFQSAKSATQHRGSSLLTGAPCALRAARTVVANSLRTRRDVIEHVGVAESRVRTVYYGVGCRGLSPGDRRRASPRAIGARVVGCAPTGRVRRIARGPSQRLRRRLRRVENASGEVVLGRRSGGRGHGGGAAGVARAVRPRWPRGADQLPGLSRRCSAHSLGVRRARRADAVRSVWSCRRARGAMLRPAVAKVTSDGGRRGAITWTISAPAAP